MKLCVDAGPTENAHRSRGIGWATRHLLDAIATSGTTRDAPVSYLRRTPIADGPASSLGWAPRSWTANWTGIDARIPGRLSEIWQVLDSTLVLPRDAQRAGADVVLATDPNALPLSRRFRTVAIVYDVIPLVLPEMYLGARRSMRRVLYDRYLNRLRRAHHLVAISETTRSDLVRLTGLDPDRISVAPLAADATVFRPIDPATARQAIATKYGIAKSYVLFVGECDPRKNMRTLAEAMQRITRDHDIMLLMVGRVRGDTIALKRTLENQLGPQSLRWLEEVPLEDMPLLYAGARVFAFPTLYEGFGLPVLEALSCGAPVVTSSTSALPEVAGDAALLIDAADVNALTAAITRVLTSSELAAELRARGPQRATQFSWKRTAELIMEQCASVARRPA